MLEHIAHYTGIRHTPYARVRPQLGKPTTWREVRWSTWSVEKPYRHGKVPKAAVLP